MTAAPIPRRRAEIVASLRRNTVLPAIVAPMYRVSGPELVIAGCRAGLVSAFPAQNPATLDELAAWIAVIEQGVSSSVSPAASWGVSMVAHSSYTRFEQELELIAAARPAFVVTALGSPRRALDAVHAYGGYVFADVSSVALARKAAAAGVDGLVLVCGGAGGQTGTANPFGFVAEVRSFFDGAIVLAGAIASGQAVRAAEILGADFTYIGTGFIPCVESMASPEYKDAVVEAVLDDIVVSSAVTGVPGTFTRRSLVNAGFDPADSQAARVDFAAGFAGTPQPRAFAAGHGVHHASQRESVADVATRLMQEYRSACQRGVL
ncbi:nitronate monooxygenase family protein [Sphingobium sp. EM0848]|uniref:NAD(P)H-dependent flavin oxidoreductase n=1 Tax=Sphingobium sp. EM0848 TaxID=2743473 RepID=UPI00159C0D90|nr:nitronate monooxygenase [Sphingobium sp. EM0848]